MFKETENLLKEMRKLQIEAEQHFFDLFLPSKVQPLAEGKWQPIADFYETDDAWVIKMEIAGVRKEDLSVTLNEGIMTIKGVRRDDFKGRWRTYYLTEINYNKFERSFPLPEAIDEASVRATYKDGLLTITIRKLVSPPTPEKRITIEIK
jgi:HSP20 family protein